LKRIFLYGTAGGLLIALLKLIEYKYFVRAYPAEVYAGLIAVIFAAAGLYFGVRSAKERVIVREVPVLAEPFVLDSARLENLGITQREHEVLMLIAAGLSNREIAEKLFVSENTVKTHSARLFEKMDVRRRTQAVQKAKELRLIP
jgi:two-component system, NarL family, response regulator LiaR